MSSGRDALRQALIDIATSSWQLPQTAIGLATGVAKTGSMPRSERDPEGNLEYRFDVEGDQPLTVGQTIVGPKDMSPESLAHERVHTQQSRRLGPLYIPMRLLGDQLSRFDTGETYFGHPMEHEAYLRTASTPNLERYLSDLESARSANDPDQRAKAVAEALRRQLEERRKMGLE